MFILARAQEQANNHHAETFPATECQLYLSWSGLEELALRLRYPLQSPQQNNHSCAVEGIPNARQSRFNRYL
jgi:hypothetical protein